MGSDELYRSSQNCINAFSIAKLTNDFCIFQNTLLYCTVICRRSQVRRSQNSYRVLPLDPAGDPFLVPLGHFRPSAPLMSLRSQILHPSLPSLGLLKTSKDRLSCTLQQGRNFNIENAQRLTYKIKNIHFS